MIATNSNPAANEAGQPHASVAEYLNLTPANNQQENPDQLMAVVDQQEADNYVATPDTDAEPVPQNTLDALFNAAAPLLEMPNDADDEAMIELAIALSLQEQPGAVPHNAPAGCLTLK